MTLYGLIFVLVVISLALWAIGRISMDPANREVLRVVVVVVVVLWLLRMLAPEFDVQLMPPLRR